MSENDPFRYDDGPYVLGALDDADRVAFEAHLSTCADCQARVAELRPTVGALAALTAADIDDPPPEPDTMLPGLLARARRERRRRRLGTVSLGAVAAAAAAALVVVAWPSSKPAPAPVANAQPFAAVLASPVSATARLVAKHWGTEIDLHCHYAEAAEQTIPYQLVVTDRAQHTFVAGTWTLAPGHDTDFTGGTAVPRADIARVQITLPDGTPILQLTP